MMATDSMIEVIYLVYLASLQQVNESWLINGRENN